MPRKYSSAFECYEAIGQWLSEEAPEQWQQITVNFTLIELDDVSERTIFYVPKNGRKQKQFSIYDTNFTFCFFDLAVVTSTPEKGYFKKCVFALQANGKYHADFEY